MQLFSYNVPKMTHFKQRLIENNVHSGDCYATNMSIFKSIRVTGSRVLKEFLQSLPALKLKVFAKPSSPEFLLR